MLVVAPVNEFALAPSESTEVTVAESLVTAALSVVMSSVVTRVVRFSPHSNSLRARIFLTASLAAAIRRVSIILPVVKAVIAGSPMMFRAALVIWPSVLGMVSYLSQRSVWSAISSGASSESEFTNSVLR